MGSCRCFSLVLLAGAAGAGAGQLGWQCGMQVDQNTLHVGSVIHARQGSVYEVWCDQQQRQQRQQRRQRRQLRDLIEPERLTANKDEHECSGLFICFVCWVSKVLALFGFIIKRHHHETAEKGQTTKTKRDRPEARWKRDKSVGGRNSGHTPRYRHNHHGLSRPSPGRDGLPVIVARASYVDSASRYLHTSRTITKKGRNMCLCNNS